MRLQVFYSSCTTAVCQHFCYFLQNSVILFILLIVAFNVAVQPRRRLDPAAGNYSSCLLVVVHDVYRRIVFKCRGDHIVQHQCE